MIYVKLRTSDTTVAAHRSKVDCIEAVQVEPLLQSLRMGYYGISWDWSCCRCDNELLPDMIVSVSMTG